jgi:hypothetical protein
MWNKSSCAITIGTSPLYPLNTERLPPVRLVYDEHEGGGRIVGETRLHRPDWKNGGDHAEELINTTSPCSASATACGASQSVEVRVNRSSRAHLQRKETTCDARRSFSRSCH